MAMLDVWCRHRLWRDGKFVWRPPQGGRICEEAAVSHPGIAQLCVHELMTEQVIAVMPNDSLTTLRDE